MACFRAERISHAIIRDMGLPSSLPENLIPETEYLFFFWRTRYRYQSKVMDWRKAGR